MFPPVSMAGNSLATTVTSFTWRGRTGVQLKTSAKMKAGTSPQSPLKLLTPLWVKKRTHTGSEVMTETKKAAGGGQTALSWNSLSGLQENQMMEAETKTACSTATCTNGTMIIAATKKALYASKKFAQVRFLFSTFHNIKPSQPKIEEHISRLRHRAKHRLQWQ